jgi:hypothetical protein
VSPVQVVGLASDKGQYVTFGAFAPPKQHYTAEFGSEIRFPGAAAPDCSLKYRAFKYWDRIRVGGSEMPMTGQGFNAVKFDPRKPARTIRRNDGNLGMSGAMHWIERRRFSLPEFKRFASVVVRQNPGR